LALAVLLCSADAQADRFGKAGQFRHYHRDRVADVLHTKVAVKVDIRAGTVAGTSTISMTLIRDTREVVLDAGDMTVHSVTSGATALSFKHRDHALRVALAGELKAGRKLELVVNYDAKPRRGMYFVRPEKGYKKRPWQAWTQGEAEDNRHWFVGYDFPDDRFTTEVLATVRKPFVAVSNGKLLATKNAEPGWRTFHWKQAVPHVNYLVTLVVGDYQRIEVEGHATPMAVWVTRRDAPHWKRSFSKTADIIRFFEGLTGEPFPFEKYDQVVVDDFLYGGMENSSATTLTNHTIHDARAALDFSSVGLVAHEAAHQWFGDLITCRSWPHLWLNEGFATYFEMLYGEARKGKAEFDWDRVSSLGWYMHGGYTRRMDEHHFDHPDDLFDGHTYIKGAWILHMLRVRVGDVQFRKAVRHYVATYRQQVVESDDLRRAFEHATGHQLQHFFEQWVHRPGHPKLTVTWRWDAKTRHARVKVRQTTSKPFKLTVPVRLQGAFGKRRWKLPISGKTHEFALALSDEPKLVEVDPDATILMEATVTKPLWERTHQVRHGTTAMSRYRAARDLADVGTKNPAKAVPVLRDVLGDSKEFHSVRAAAASALGQLGGDVAEIALIAALKDRDALVRRAAANALASFESKGTLRALKDAFEDDRSYKVAAAALTSYAAIRGSDGLSLVKDGLSRKSHRDVILRAAIDALAEIGTAKAFDLVMDQTKWGEPTNGRRSAAAALGTMGVAEARFKERARVRLEALLDDPRFWLRLDAAEALGSLGDNRSLAPLQKLLARASTRRMARTVAVAVEALQHKDKGAQDLGDQLRELRQRLEALEQEQH